MGTRVTMIRRFLLRDLKKEEEEGNAGIRTRSYEPKKCGSRSLNSSKLRRIEGNFLHSWQEAIDGRTGPDDDMQRTPGSHKAAQSRDTDGIQGVSDRRLYEEEEEIRVSKSDLMLNTEDVVLVILTAG